MTARRIVVAVLALASLTVGIYAQGGGGARRAAGAVEGGGRAGGGRRAAGWSTSARQPHDRRVGRAGAHSRCARVGLDGEAVCGKGPAAAVEPGEGEAAERRQGDERHHLEPPTRDVLRSAEALGLHLVRDAAQTMSFAEVQKMLAACPGPEGGAPMIRMPDALEANIQKAVDLGVIGIVVPTVDDALEARDAARFSRYPPFGRRSSGAGTASQFWAKVPGGFRQTANDNFLVVVMLETMESIINADEIANTFGLDVVIQGNSDLSHFSGWSPERRALRGAVDHQPQRDAEGRQVLGQRRSAVSDGPSVERVDPLRAERAVARRIRVPGARHRSAGASKIATSVCVDSR